MVGGETTYIRHKWAITLVSVFLPVPDLPAKNKLPVVDENNLSIELIIYSV